MAGRLTLLWAGIALIAIVAGEACGQGKSADVSETPQDNLTVTAVPHVVPISTVLPATISPVPTSTLTPPPATRPTPTPTAMDGFHPPDTIAGVGDVTELRLRGQVFRLEIARTDAERARGLMNRESLPSEVAMLFVYEADRPLTFWMKNTLIPLDILFVDSGGLIVDIQTMQPQPGVADSNLRRYSSAAPARYAVEMNAGLADQHELAVGDQVQFR